MEGVLLKDLYIAKSNVLVTVVSLVVLGFGLLFFLETSAWLVLAPVSRGQIIGEKFVFYIRLAGGISLPCAYLFDPEKSQTVFMVSFMASSGIIVGLVLLTNLFSL